MPQRVTVGWPIPIPLPPVEEEDVSWEVRDGRVCYSIGGRDHESDPGRVLKRDVLVIPRAVSDVLEEITSAADAANCWTRPTVSRQDRVESDYGFRNCWGVGVSGDAHPSLGRYERILKTLSGAWAVAYRDLVNPYMSVQGHEEWHLLRYGRGEFFRPHVDQAPGNASLIGRRLSMVCLGASDDCVGGDLVFMLHGLKVTPRGAVYLWLGDGHVPESEEAFDPARWAQLMPEAPGTVVEFVSSANTPHWAQPVKAGRKTSLVTWFH